MNSQDNIEKLLERLGSEWPDNSSIVEPVMQTIESAPVRVDSRQRSTRLVKTLFALAASLVLVATVWIGSREGQQSVYAQIMDAVHSARTIHIIQHVQPIGHTTPVKGQEQWYERGVGFRCESERQGDLYLGNLKDYWRYSKQKNVAIRSKSHGIDDALFDLNIQDLVQGLNGTYGRYPEADQTIDGQPCQAYWTKLGKTPDPHISDGTARLLVFLYSDSRIARATYQMQHEKDWVPVATFDFRFDQPMDRALFEPHFADDVKIVDADKVFDAFANLKEALHVEERSGLVYAIQRVERFENGGVLVVSSVRGTEETLKKDPLTQRPVGPGRFVVDGPATDYNGSPLGPGYFRLTLAHTTDQGIDVAWWILVPRFVPPDHFEVAPGRIKLPVAITPRGEFAKSFTDNHGVTQTIRWDVEVDVPRPASLPTLEDVCNRVYAEQVALEPVLSNNLDISTYDKHRDSTIGETTAPEYAKAVADKIRSWLQADLEGQLVWKFSAESQKDGALSEKEPAILLSYNSLVDDATLTRVAKHEQLERLYLAGTRITDGGLQYLRGLKKLRELDLSNTPVTDSGLKELEGLSALRTLYLKGTKVTADGIARLKAAIPQLKFIQ